MFKVVLYKNDKEVNSKSFDTLGDAEKFKARMLKRKQYLIMKIKEHKK